MKSIIIFISLSIISISVSAKAEKWLIDTAHSKVGFEISHLVIATVEGKFTGFTGDIMFDLKDPLKNKASFSINATIDSNTIDTANEKRDKHLRSGDFFDVKKYPKLTFVTKKVATNDGKYFRLEGDLTIAGKTKSVTLDTKYLGSVDAYDVKRVVFTATTTIKRADFGLTWNDLVESGPVVGSEVEIELKIQAKRAADIE